MTWSSSKLICDDILMIKDIHPWQQVVTVLRRLGDPQPYAKNTRIRRATFQASAQQVFVRVVDRPSGSTATVEWGDSTSGYYGDQIWRRGKAKCSGICAATGVAIARGDLVYRPRGGRGTPANAHAMILASVVPPFSMTPFGAG
jgi:hypothetical protein